MISSYFRTAQRAALVILVGFGSLAPQFAVAEPPAAVEVNSAAQLAATGGSAAVEPTSAPERAVAPASDPHNAIAVVIDTSVSFQGHFGEAYSVAQRLIADLSAVKLKRRDRAKTPDRIAIIALDALPDVIFAGTLEELKKVDVTAFQARLEARKDKARCTDVASALSLAASQLTGDPATTHKYLFVFSDLVHEPPRQLGKKGRKRQPACEAPSAVATGTPWAALADTEVHAFWMPYEQNQAWRAAAAAHAIRMNIWSESEAATVRLAAPERPKKERDLAAEARDLRELKEGAKSVGSTAAGLALKVVVAGLILVIGLLWLSKRRRRAAAPYPRRVAAATPGPAAPAALRRGPVAPLVLPRR